MRVLHLRASGGVYGAERVIATLAAEQVRLGLEPHVACLERGDRGPFFEALRASGIPAHAIPDRGGFHPAGVVRLVQLVRRLAPDVVHSHGYKTDVLVAPLAVAPSRPRLVATNHNWIGDTAAVRVYERLDALALRAFDAVVAVSRQVGEDLLAAGIRRAIVIPNGICRPPSRHGAQERLRDALGLLRGTPVVGFVGRLAPEKALSDLLDAAAAGPLARVHFVLVGDGPARGEVEAGVRARTLAGRVHLLGRRDDVEALLPELDALVLPSRREGTPLVILEAMAAGIPPIATHVGGVPDVVEDGRTGILVPPGDPAALAEAIRRVVDDPGLRRRLAEAGRHAARTRFSAGAMAARYLDVYRGVGAPWRRDAAAEANA